MSATAVALVRIAETTGRCPSCDQYSIETTHDEDGLLTGVFCGDPDCGWIIEVPLRR